MPYIYRLNQLLFQKGGSMELPQLTIFVGPNNSGKSRIIKDIVSLTTNEPGKTVLVGSVATSLPVSIREAADAYNIRPIKIPNGNDSIRVLNPVLEGQSEQQIPPGAWPDGLNAGGRPSPQEMRQYFGASLIACLTTEHRLRLVAEGRLDGASRTTVLQQLYLGGRATEKEIRETVKSAFPDTELALDFSLPPIIQFRVGADFSTLPQDPRDALPTLAGCERLDDQGDGIRSFSGIVTAIKCVDRPVVLIDEPEAFLHPPQAYRIGEFIAGTANAGRQIVVATHSVDLLRGLVSKQASAMVVRLDRTGNDTRYSILNNEEIAALYNDPLLSGSGVLNGIFFSGVIVTEADADSRFYAALSAKIDPARDIHFVNADNKQTVPKVLSIYRKMGVRAVGIVDTDVLNDAGEFAQQLDAAGIVGADRVAALAARQRIEDEIKAIPLNVRMKEIAAKLQELLGLAEAAAAGDQALALDTLPRLRRSFGNLRDKATVWAVIKMQGRNALGAPAQDFDYIYKLFSTRGLFINPAGELEASLSECGLAWREKSRTWLQEAIPLLIRTVEIAGAEPWKLMRGIHTFLDTR